MPYRDSLGNPSISFISLAKVLHVKGYPESSLNPPFTSEGHSYFIDKKSEGDHDKSRGRKGSLVSLKPDSCRGFSLHAFLLWTWCRNKTKKKQKQNIKVTLPYNNTIVNIQRRSERQQTPCFHLGHCNLEKGQHVPGERHWEFKIIILKTVKWHGKMLVILR